MEAGMLAADCTAWPGCQWQGAGSQEQVRCALQERKLQGQVSEGNESGWFGL